MILRTNDFAGQNLEKIGRSLRSGVEHAAFLGLLPVDEKRLSPIPWNSRSQLPLRRAEEFNQVLRDFCAESKFPMLDFWQDWIQAPYQELLMDGLHPSSRGHAKMFSEVRAFLNRQREFALPPIED